MFLKKLLSLFKPKTQAPTKFTNGTVKFFDRRKGFGFIRIDATGREVFVHASDLKEMVDRGYRVMFALEETDKGLQARQVSILEKVTLSDDNADGSTEDIQTESEPKGNGSNKRKKNNTGRKPYRKGPRRKSPKATA